MREREGPVAKRWEGEGISAAAAALTRLASLATLSRMRERGMHVNIGFTVP
jgi:hypothetical protein